MPRIHDITGKQFGMLTVLKYSHTNKRKRAVWVCKCKCGSECLREGHGLLLGKTNHCGCVHIQRLKNNAIKRWEGHIKTPKKELKTKKDPISKTRIYSIWSGMKERCLRPSHMHFSRYGGRGITICSEWLNSFHTFKKWAESNGYHEKLTLDRIDNNSGYSPENCRWATYKQQANNSRRNRILTIDGISKTATEWSEYSRVKYTTILARIKKGKTGTELINPVKKVKNGKSVL